MSSSTATIVSKNSTMNNTNDRKRPISSSIRPSPSPPSAKRHGLTSNSRHSTNQIQRQSERPGRSKQQQQHYRHVENKSSSSESSRSSSNSINQDYSSATINIQNSNEILSTKKPHLNSHPVSDTIFTKKTTSIAVIVKPTTTNIDQRNYDSDEEFEQTKQILTKSSHVVVPSSVMTIVTAPDLSKKSLMKDNVIIQQIESSSNNSTKLVKFVGSQSAMASSSIKMLSSGDGGVASALRVPTKIQLTKTLLLSSSKPVDQNSSSISSSQPITEESNHSSDISIDIPQKSNVKYHSSTALPPTPPPPVIDNRINTEQEKNKEVSTINTKTVEETNSSPTDEIKSKRHSSILSDWSVPSTSELSPASLTSSSPDLTQNSIPLDDSLIELDSSINFKQIIKRRHRSLSSFPKSSRQTNEKLLRPIKSKSLTRLSKLSDVKLMLIEQKRSFTSSPILKLSSSQRTKKRQRDQETFLLHQKSKKKYFPIDLDQQTIIQNLLNEMIDRISSTNDETDNTLKNLLFKPVPQPRIAFDVAPFRRKKNPTNKKRSSSSQSTDWMESNESRSMIITRNELDELAYLLHANVQRAEYERLDNPAKVEERMRDMWSQMSNQKKNSYYKRVIQIYKRPNRDVVITSSSSTIESNGIPSNELMDNPNPLIDLKRQTSTPLSFHSLPSSTPGDDSPVNESTSKSDIFTDIVNELIKGAKGLDKLSCSPTTFTNTIHHFVQSSAEEQNQILGHLEQYVEKKCSTQLNRASLFWKQKINYFVNKHQIHSSSESINQLTLIVKYFYLYVLSLNCQKQEAEFETALKDLVQGSLASIDSTYCSATLTSIIEDLILPSTLANDYLASQVLIINQIEYSLPLIRNSDFEHELLQKEEITISTNPFGDLNDLEEYLKRCENMTTTIIPSYPIQQTHHSSMYYPPYHPLPPQYYYSPPPQSSDVNNYYYNPSNMYPYGQPTSYYHLSTPYNNNNNNNNNEQYKYYYNQQPSYSYSSQSNSTNDIPSLPTNTSLHRTYRPVQRTYSNSQQPPTPTTPAVFDPTAAVVSPQSKPMNTTYSS